METKNKKRQSVSRMSSKKKRKCIEISQGREETAVLIPNAEKTKIMKVFDYKENYITCSIVPDKDINEYLLPKEDYCCNCESGICLKDDCNCVIMHNQLYECNNECSCFGKSCFNRLIQKGIQKRLMIKYINQSKGFGVFAYEMIKQGEFVCEYIGEIIPKEKALKKIEINHLKCKPNYVLQIKEHFSKVTISTFIDSEKYGNVSRFINHSCEPNLYYDFIRYKHYIPHVAFFAKSDIKEGAELTFSYCDIDNENDEYNSITSSYKLCECGSDKCKKYIPN